MEEDIKILEDIKTMDKWVLGTREKQALENLIKGYRELEEKVKELNFYILAGANTENWISKSKIKEKIEEYQLNMKKYEYADKKIFNENNIRQEVITVLQELMEDK